MRVVAATGGCRVQEAAGDIGLGHFAGVLVLDLVQAAAAAPVAKRLPFALREFGERQLPEQGSQRTHLANSAATACGPLSVGSVPSGLPSGSNR